ncbi:MAG TPA: GNAT family N-acetyltransferase [Candidatus Eisenbacteria bacterium]|nr:GNAT family N-acetyltransferase [Candidatus Eisenbacteria bacterium]
MPLEKPSAGAAGAITYSDDPSRVNLAQLLSLYHITYWAKGRTVEQVARALRHSHPVITAWDGDRLVGFTRVISDLTYRATIWDVIVAESHQKRGIGREMMRLVLEHPDLKTVSMFVLLTKDQHRFYEHLGFETDSTMSMTLRR